MKTLEMFKKNNNNILRRITDEIRILELHELNIKLNPLNPVYDEKIKHTN